MQSTKSQIIGKGEKRASEPPEKKVWTQAKGRSNLAESRKASGESEASDPVMETYGCLGSKTDTETVMAELREQ
jgi:hypothetical protein